MISIGNGDVFVDVQAKDLPKFALPGKHDPRQFEKGEESGSNLAFGAAVAPLQGEDHPEDDDIRDAGAGNALLDRMKICGCSAGLLGDIAQEVAKEDVGVQKSLAHPPPARSITSLAIASSASSRSSSALFGGPSVLKTPAVLATTLPVGESRTLPSSKLRATLSPSLSPRALRNSAGIVICPLRVTTPRRSFISCPFWYVVRYCIEYYYFS